ncbi:unnamed protein product [Pylaiella littoralis]
MHEEGRNDDFVTTDTLEEKVHELGVADAKEEEAGVLEKVKAAFRTVTGGVGRAWSTLGEWRDQETPLRKMFKTARLELDDAAATVRERTIDRKEEMRKRMEKMAEERKKRFQEFDKSGGEKEKTIQKRCLWSVCRNCVCGGGGGGGGSWLVHKYFQADGTGKTVLTQNSQFVYVGWQATESFTLSRVLEHALCTRITNSSTLYTLEMWAIFATLINSFRFV